MFSQYLLSKKRGDTAQKDESMFNKNRSVVYPDEVMPAAEEASPAMSGLSAAGALGGGSTSPNAAFSADSPAPGVTPNQGGASGWLSQNKGQFIAAMGAIAQHFGQTPGQVSAGRMLMQHGQAEMEQQRKDEAAQALGFATAEGMAARKQQLEMGMTEAQIESEKTIPGLRKAQTGQAEADAKLTTERVKEIAPNINLVQQRVKNLEKEHDLLKLEEEYKRPFILYNPLGDGRDFTVPSGEALKFADLAEKVLAAKQAYKAGGIELDALEGLKGQTIDFGGIKIPATMLKTAMPGLVQQLESSTAIKVANIRANADREVANIASKARENATDLQGYASVRKVAEDYDKVLMDPISQQMFLTKNAEGKMVVKPEAKPLFESYATTGIALINSPDPADKDRGKFMVNRAFSLQAITPEEYNKAIRGDIPGASRAMPRPPMPATSAAPVPERKVFVGSGLATPKDVPLGAVERVIGGAASLPGTFASEGLKAYREQRDLTRGR